MRIAYLILAHRYPEQLGRLVDRIWHAEDEVSVHVDLRADIEPFRRAVGGKARFVERRHVVRWCRFSTVEATLGLLEEARSTCRPDYYTLLSGQDYPIKPFAQFRSFLERNRGSEFIETYNLLERWASARVRYQKFYFERDVGRTLVRLQNLFNRLPYRRRMVGNMVPFGGSQWWTLTDQCVSYILGLLRNHPEIVRFFRSTWVPDEMLFQTVVMNSSFAATVNRNHLREIRFEDGRTHPELLKEKDYETLVASDRFFARKFDETVDSGILDRLDRLMGRTGSESQLAVDQHTGD